MTTTTTTIARAIAPSADAAHLGDIVLAELAGVGARRCTVERLRTELESRGLPGDWAGESIPPLRALRRAVTSTACPAGTRAIQERGGAALVRGDDDAPEYTVLARFAPGDDGTLTIVSSMEATTDPAVVAYLQAMEEAFQLRSSYVTGADVGRIAREAIAASNGVRMVTRGGTYWIPARFASTVRDLADALRTACGADLHCIPVGDSEAARAAAAAAAREHIGAEIAAVRERLREYAEGARSTRASTYDARLAELVDLRARAEVYADVLGALRGELLAEISQAEDAARQAIGAPAAAPATTAQDAAPAIAQADDRWFE